MDRHAIRFVRALVLGAGLSATACGSTTSGNDAGIDGTNNGTCGLAMAGTSCMAGQSCTITCSVGGGGFCACSVVDGGTTGTWQCGACAGPLPPPSLAA